MAGDYDIPSFTTWCRSIPRMVVHFRSRIGKKLLSWVNEAVDAPKKKTEKKCDKGDEPPPNAGNLIVDVPRISAIRRT
jgi:hypothetical protein